MQEATKPQYIYMYIHIYIYIHICIHTHVFQAVCMHVRTEAIIDKSVDSMTPRDLYLEGLVVIKIHLS